MEEQRKRDLEREWIKAMAVINGIVLEAIDQGKVIEIKSSSCSDEIKNNGWGDVEITFLSGSKLKAHVELDLKPKHRTHRAKKG